MSSPRELNYDANTGAYQQVPGILGDEASMLDHIGRAQTQRPMTYPQVFETPPHLVGKVLDLTTMMLVDDPAAEGHGAMAAHGAHIPEVPSSSLGAPTVPAHSTGGGTTGPPAGDAAGRVGRHPFSFRKPGVTAS